MTRLLNSLAIILISATFFGAAKTKKVTVFYRSDPIGATLYEQGHTLLRSELPKTVAYQLNDGCTSFPPLTARWPSGAEATITPWQLCTAAGSKQQFTFQRPAAFPGAEIDVQWAIHLQQMDLKRRQAIAAMFAHKTPPPPLQPFVLPRIPPPPRLLQCISTLIGNIITTNCS